MKRFWPKVRRNFLFTFGLLGVPALVGLAAPPDNSLQLAVRTGATNEAGDRDLILEWNAQSNVAYRIQSRLGFESNTGWSTFDVAPAGAGTFKVPIGHIELGSDQIRQFFRVCAPSNEILAIEPAVISTNGGTVYLSGQGLDTNGTLRIGSLVVPAHVLQPGALYSFDLPALGEGTYDLEWLSGGAVVAARYKLFSVTGQPTPVGEASNQRLLEPPDEPPASPQRSAPFVSKKGYDKWIWRVNPANGECVVSVEDFHVPGRGLDFVWARTYRSRTGADSNAGQNWSHSYDIRVSSNDVNSVRVWDGTGRSDVYFVNSNGLYTANELFNAGSLTGGVFALNFPDTGRWEFRSLGDSLAPGKISRVVDRLGNAFGFTYDAFGRLSQILDTVGRTYVVEYYPGTNRVLSVTDFSGRQVVYTYYHAGDLGGGEGDLRSVRSPLVFGTPTKNDFGNGKITTYTYSTGFPDDRLNHNLVRITDPRSQTWLQLSYSSALDASYDRVVACVRGDAVSPPTTYAYESLTPSPSNSFAVVKTTVTDPLGNISEEYFDSLNRGVIHRDLATRLSGDKPRPADPDSWETRYAWNSDSMLKRTVYPRGNVTECVYEADLNPNAPAAHRGDLRAARTIACCADLDRDGYPDVVVTRYAYDPRFGSPAMECRNVWDGTIKGTARGPRQTISLDGTYDPKPVNQRKGAPSFVPDVPGDYQFSIHPSEFLISFSMPAFTTQAIDPRGNVTTATYDTQGKQIEIRHTGYLLDGSDKPVENFEYNGFGQFTAVLHAADATGYRRRDEVTYGTGAQAGYALRWIVDAQGPIVTITAAQRDSRGNVTQTIDPRGNTNDYIYNQLDQLVRQKVGAGAGPVCNPCSAIQTDFIFDANDNVVRVEHDNRNQDGALNPTNATWTTLFTYDTLDRCIAIQHETGLSASQTPLFTTNRFVYDPVDNLIETDSPEAVNGRQPANLVISEYDSRNLVLRRTHATGTSDASADTFDYDENGNLKSSVLGGGGGISGMVTTYSYDGLDRCILVVDAMGNTETSAYDRNGNLIYRRADGELNDVRAGKANQRLAETRYEYDSLNRLTRKADSFFDVFTELPLLDGSATTTFAYAPNGRKASVTDDNGNATRFSYDTQGRPALITDSRQNTIAYTYDANGNVSTKTQTDRADLGGTVQTFVVNYQYDALNRCILDSDNLGNLNRYGYDSLDNLVQHVDPRGVLQINDYDGLGRKLRVWVDKNADGAMSPNELLTAQAWDDNGRLVSITDANSNTTAYAYDALDRVTSRHFADGTTESLIWSPRSNLSLRTDPNGTVIAYTYDDLNRCVLKDITPAGSVSHTTSFEVYQYDGLSRVVLASNDVSGLTFRYDSLGNRIAVSQSILNSSFSTLNSYDSLGNRLSVTYPSGRIVRYSYDSLNRITNTSYAPGLGALSINLATFAYEGPRLSRIARASGINTRLLYDGDATTTNAPGDFGWQQVSQINHQRATGGTVIDRRGFTYDAAQNKTSRTQLTPFVPGRGGTTNVWEYDTLSQMKRAINTTGTGGPGRVVDDYVLDANGNRQFVTNGGNTGVYSMDATLPEPGDFEMNQYSGTPFGGRQYDQNGNLVSVIGPVGAIQFTYDYANRLVEVDRSVGPAIVPLVSFSYDALGRRIAKTTYPPAPSAPVTTEFVYNVGEECDDGNCDDGEEYQNGALKKSIVFPHALEVSGRISINDAGTFNYVICDELGNALALTDGSGNVLERYEYDDFGLPHFLTSDGVEMTDSGTGTTVTSSPAGNRFLFRGMEWDSEIGLYYFGHSQGATTGPLKWMAPESISSRYATDPYVEDAMRYATDPYAEDSMRYMDPRTGDCLSRDRLQVNPQGVLRPELRTFANNNPWTLGMSAVTVRGWNPTQKQDIAGRVKFSRDKLKGTTGTQGDFNLAHRFSVEIDGVIGGVHSIEGLETETEVVEYKDGNDPITHKAGKVRVTKDWSNTHEFYNWRKAVMNGKVERKSISIIFHNDAGEADRINLFTCWPRKFVGPGLNARVINVTSCGSQPPVVSMVARKEPKRGHVTLLK